MASLRRSSTVALIVAVSGSDVLMSGSSASAATTTTATTTTVSAQRASVLAHAKALGYRQTGALAVLSATVAGTDTALARKDATAVKAQNLAVTAARTTLATKIQAATTATALSALDKAISTDPVVANVAGEVRALNAFAATVTARAEFNRVQASDRASIAAFSASARKALIAHKKNTAALTTKTNDYLAMSKSYTVPVTGLVSDSAAKITTLVATPLASPSSAPAAQSSLFFSTTLAQTLSEQTGHEQSAYTLTSTYIVGVLVSLT
jgi:hypothetical protein